jgi:hypothetical protein
MGQLEWARKPNDKDESNEIARSHQPSNEKTKKKWGAYISNQVNMHAYHLNFETLDNECCKFY